MLVEDVSHTTQTRSIMFVSIHINIVYFTRLLLMIVEADHVLQIGRNIATHVIVIERLLSIISIHLTLVDVDRTAQNRSIVMTHVIVITSHIVKTATHRCIPRRLVILVVEVDNMIMMMGLLGVCIGVVAATSILEATSIVRATNAH
jgi:hypothetical protein